MHLKNKLLIKVDQKIENVFSKETDEVVKVPNRFRQKEEILTDVIEFLNK